MENEARADVVQTEKHLKDSIKMLEDKNSKIEIENAQQQQTISNLNSKDKKSSAEILSLRENIEKLNSEILQKTDESSTLLKNSSKLERKFGELSAKLKEIEMDRKAQKKISESLARKYDSEKNKSENFRTQIESGKRNIEKLTDKVLELESRVAGLQVDHKGELENNEDLKAQNQNLLEKMTLFESDVLEKSGKIKQLETSIEKSSEKIECLNALLVSKETDLGQFIANFTLNLTAYSSDNIQGATIRPDS